MGGRRKVTVRRPGELAARTSASAMAFDFSYGDALDFAVYNLDCSSVSLLLVGESSTAAAQEV